MSNRQQQLYATLGAAFLLAGCVPDSFKVDVNLTAPDGADAIPTPTEIACQATMTVRTSTDKHLLKGHRVRISGPTIDGDYRIRPMGSDDPQVPPHQFAMKDHDALKSTGTGKDFESLIELKGGGHGNLKLHFYKITADLNASGCPSKLKFEARPHNDSSDGGDDDHGGDADLD